MTTPGGTQEVTIINEPGLYAVILRSDKPEAKAFKFINLKAFFFLCPAIQRPKKANTRQSLRSKSYLKKAGVKWGTICLELSSCCRTLSVSYNTQNDIVNLIL